MKPFADPLDTCREPTIQDSLTTILDTLKAQKAHLEQPMDELINADADLKHKRARLMSIKGGGAITAQSLLAEMYDLDHYESARAAVTDAGLVPRQHQSGKLGQLSSQNVQDGQGRSAGALYMPVLSTMTHNPLVRDLKERLEQAGKHKMAIIGATMRKLLHLAYGVLKNDTDFDPNYAFWLI